MSHVPLAAIAARGESEGPYTGAKRIRFLLHGFAELPHGVQHYSATSSIECYGYEWYLEVCPGGAEDEYEGKVAVFLCFGTEDCKTPSHTFTIRVLKSDGTVFDTEDCDSTAEYADFGERTTVIEHCLVDGTLTIEVDLQVRSKALQLWAPKTRIGSDLARLLESGTDADVTFVLGKTRIAAHRGIIAMRAQTLYALCDDANDNGEVEIAGVDVETFKAVLIFIYSEVFDQPATKAEALSLLELADRFGCVALKLHAEAALAEQGVAVDEAAELLLFADGHGYPQLKELAMDVVLANYKAVKATEGWKKVAESNGLLQECLQAFVDGGSGAAAAADADPNQSMTVSDLRRALEIKGLDCDGPRELLEKRLLEPDEGARKKARTE
jgi:hypothetical protein